MSTYWGYVCRSHIPPLPSEHWLNHGEDVLRALAEQRHAFAALLPTLEAHGLELSGLNGATNWLAEHSACNIALHNEYGDVEELIPPTTPARVPTPDATP